MKKFILNVIAIVCFSFMSFASTNEINQPLNLDVDELEIIIENDKLVETINLVKIIIDNDNLLDKVGFWFCYEIDRHFTYDDDIETIITTITYRCTYHTFP